MKRTRSLLLLVGIIFASTAQTQNIESLTVTCNGCHGDQGVSQWTDMPTIAGIDSGEDEASILGGQQMGYLRRAFEEYTAGEREQLDKMQEAMDALSDQEVEALLQYYASQQ